ncbi:type VI secretion system protein TssA [Azospirillum sp. sgz301742]
MSVALPDFSAVLAPLPGETPTGPSLRYDPVYSAIGEARRGDDPSLPMGVWQTAQKRADWDEVARLCMGVLETRSKDLQIACWLLEALVHRHGLVALGPSLNMLAGLCERFWDGLHPQIDDGDLGARVSPLEWLNKKLPSQLHMLPITRSGSQPVVTFSYTDYQNAQRLSIIAAKDPRAGDAARAKGEALLPDVQASAAATPVAFHRAQHAQLAEAVAATEALSALLDERCGRDAPGLVLLRETLTGLQGWVDTVLRAKGEEPAMPADVTAAPAEQDGVPNEFPDAYDEDEAAGDGAPQYHAGPIRSREEAYYWLAEAADFLLRTEPHSPTPYLVHRALGWANMPLHEVLLEVSRGRNDLAAVFDLLGFNFTELTQKTGAR